MNAKQQSKYLAHFRRVEKQVRKVWDAAAIAETKRQKSTNKL